ncbi:hypothetical protein SLA2020_061820 [Shorea laevis]
MRTRMRHNQSWIVRARTTKIFLWSCFRFGCCRWRRRQREMLGCGEGVGDGEMDAEEVERQWTRARKLFAWNCRLGLAKDRTSFSLHGYIWFNL